MKVFELLKANESLLRVMHANGILTKDVFILDMLQDIEEMKRQGEKQIFINETIATKYGISARTVYNTLSRLNNDVEI